MVKGPKLISSQWELIAKALSNIGQAIILFAFAALFVPETVGLSKDFSKVLAFGSFVVGLFILWNAVIIIKKGE